MQCTEVRAGTTPASPVQLAEAVCQPCSCRLARLDPSILASQLTWYEPEEVNVGGIRVAPHVGGVGHGACGCAEVNYCMGLIQRAQGTIYGWKERTAPGLEQVRPMAPWPLPFLTTISCT